LFDEKANRVANMLMSRGVRKGQKVAILLMNGIEWLPIYFGALKAGAMAVPLNYRYAADEIKYCLELADADVLVSPGIDRGDWLAKNDFVITKGKGLYDGKIIG
jgi:acyl-CoA synthetase (AMP-forming)/AMP-acid ligase II